MFLTQGHKTIRVENTPSRVLLCLINKIYLFSFFFNNELIFGNNCFRKTNFLWIYFGECKFYHVLLRFNFVGDKISVVSSELTFSVGEYVFLTEVYLEPSRTSTMELF